ncbi:hypothetical protein CRUP_005723, partial [Coryphaenoides rupestris]
MSALSTDKKPLVDYGVQIRFIKDLHDTGGGYPEKSKATATATAPSNKYGVAVHVQGISGQPYLVLKDGEKGDSYGVQLKAQPLPQSPSPGPASRYNSLGRDQTKPPTGFANSYSSPVGNTRSSSVSPAEDEEGELFRSPLKRPPGDGQAGGQVGDGERGAGAKSHTLPKMVVNGSGKKDEWESGDEFNEAGLKPVKRNGAGTRSVRQNGFTSTGSLGRHSGKTIRQEFPLESFPEGPPPLPPSSSSSSSVGAEEEPAPAIDTNSLAPINKLISKFNCSTPGSAPQTRGRSGARQRLRFDERQRSRSLDARKEAAESLPPPASTPPVSATPNPYGGAPTPQSIPSVKTLASSGSTSVGLGTNTASAVPTATAPAPSMPSFASSQSFVAKDTPPPAIPKKPDTPAPLRHQSRSLDVSSEEDTRVKQAIYNILKDRSSESDASIKRKVNLIYDQSSTLKVSDFNTLILAEGRMAREAAESTVRQQEDQLAGMQDELRRDMATLQADLAEAAMWRLRQEETLHQRERELTALKGALKEEVESHDGELETLREQYSQDMENLRRTMEQVSQEQIEAERQRVNASMVLLGDELEVCREQGHAWKSRLETTAQALRDTRHELQKSQLEKEEFEAELRDLQDLKKQMPGLDDEHFEAAQRCHDDLRRTHAELDQQKAEFDEKCEELRGLSAASKEREAGLRAEIDGLKDQSQSDKAELEKAKEDLQEANTRLRERLSRLTRLQSSASLGPGAEDALEDENRALRGQLEEARRGAARLAKEKEDLGRRLDEREQEREALRRGKSDLEEQKRLLDRALDKINKEVSRLKKDLLAC